MKRERYLILIRHAHQATSSFREEDVGLSKSGESQVESLKRDLREKWMERGLKDFLFLSSPKQRCIKTLEPIAALVNRSVQVEPLLNEHETGEDYGDFSKRAERVYKAFLASETSWVCCSHGDWIPEFVETVLGLSVSIKKSGVLVLVLSPEGQLRLGEI